MKANLSEALTLADLARWQLAVADGLFRAADKAVAAELPRTAARLWWEGDQAARAAMKTKARAKMALTKWTPL